MRYVILWLLKDGPKHGYEIIKQLEEKTQGFYSPSPGTLYPTLQYLDDLGLVRADQEGERKTYHLTEAGKAELEEHAEHLEHFWSRFMGRGAQGAGRQEMNFLHDTIHSIMNTVRGGVHGVMHGSTDPATLRQIRQVLEKAHNDIRDILSQAASTSRPEPRSSEESAGPAETREL